MAVFEVTVEDDHAFEHLMGGWVSPEQFKQEQALKGHQGSELDGDVQKIVNGGDQVGRREMRH